MKEVLTIVGAMILLAVLMLGYNLYTNSEQREMYELCLKTKSDTTLIYCHMPR